MLLLIWSIALQGRGVYVSYMCCAKKYPAAWYPWLFPSYAYAQTPPCLCITGYQRLSPVQPIVTAAVRAIREGLQFYYWTDSNFFLPPFQNRCNIRVRTFGTRFRGGIVGKKNRNRARIFRVKIRYCEEWRLFLRASQLLNWRHRSTGEIQHEGPKFGHPNIARRPSGRVHSEGNKSLRVGDECANVCRTIVECDQIWFVRAHSRAPTVSVHTSTRASISVIRGNTRDIVRRVYTERGERDDSHARGQAI